MSMKILEIYNQLLESVDYGYFKDRANIHDYDAILFGKQSELPSRYARWFGEVKWMSKEEYFGECARLQNTSYNDQFKNVVPSKVKTIEEKMASGIKYDMPYLDYVNKTQEGRHRVMAASELGQEEIPVLVLYANKGVNDLSGMIGKWKDLVEVNGGYYLKIVDDGTGNGDIRLLSCIVRDLDYYYLDLLFRIKKYPSLYKSIEYMIYWCIKNGDKSPLSYINSSIVYWDGDFEVDFEVLKWAVVLRAMRNNAYVIDDAVVIKDGNFYLKLLDGIGDNYDEYDSCEKMLLSVRSKKYIEEYDLIIADERSWLYDIEEGDIKVIMGLFEKANKKN